MSKVAKEAKKGTPGAKKKDAGGKKARPVPTERWGEEPDEHDYPAAASFLSLICEPTDVRKLVTALKGAPIVRHQAKDLLRASGLALLPVDNVHVAADLAKIDRGEPLSPVLLVRGDVRRGVTLTIADGYHRVCASYHTDENAEIPCHLVDYRGPSPVPAFRQRSAVNTGVASRATPDPIPTAGPTSLPPPPSQSPAPAPVPGAAPSPAFAPEVPPGFGASLGTGSLPRNGEGSSVPEDHYPEDHYGEPGK